MRATGWAAIALLAACLLTRSALHPIPVEAAPTVAQPTTTSTPRPQPPPSPSGSPPVPRPSSTRLPILTSTASPPTSTQPPGSATPTPTATLLRDDKPTVQLTLAEDHLEAGETLVVHLEAADDRGLERLWWWTDGAADPALATGRPADCDGAPICRRTWSASVSQVGRLIVKAQARDVGGQLSPIARQEIVIRAATPAATARTATPISTRDSGPTAVPSATSAAAPAPGPTVEAAATTAPPEPTPSTTAAPRVAETPGPTPAASPSTSPTPTPSLGPLPPGVETSLVSPLGVPITPAHISFGFRDDYGSALATNVRGAHGVARYGTLHLAWDLVIPGAPRNGQGYPVFAPIGGRIVRTSDPVGGPNGIWIEDRRLDLRARLMHLDALAPSIADGGRVEPGQWIGLLGGQGTEEFPHLHFSLELISTGERLDPGLLPIRAAESGKPPRPAGWRRETIDWPTPSASESAAATPEPANPSPQPGAPVQPLAYRRGEPDDPRNESTSGPVRVPSRSPAARPRGPRWERAGGGCPSPVLTPRPFAQAGPPPPPIGTAARLTTLIWSRLSHWLFADLPAHGAVFAPPCPTPPPSDPA